MTSPSVRRQRSQGFAVPQQPNFGVADEPENHNYNNNNQSGLGYQLGAPFQLQNPIYGYMPEHYHGNVGEQHNLPAAMQPMAGPSRLAEPINRMVQRDFNVELEENFRRRHIERVQRRGIQQPRNSEEIIPQLQSSAVELQQPNQGVFQIHNALRNQRLQQQYEQNDLEFIEFQAEQLNRSQQHEARVEAEQAAYNAAQQQIRAASTLPLGRRSYIEPVARHTVGRMNYICEHCHALHFLDEKLTKSSNNHPKFSTCCLEGQIVLPMPMLPPQPLRNLMNGEDLRSKEFLEHIRQYNAAFAFTSTAVKMNQQVLSTSGPYAFVIHGELHHFMGSLLPEEGSSPRYAQLYIHDSHAALSARNMNNQNLLNPGIMIDLQEMLLRENPLVPLYKRAYDIMMEKPAEERNNLEARIILSPTEDKCRYNLPTADEVAAVIPGSGENEDVDEHRDIILRLKQGGLKRISQIHPLYAPLHYILLFPRAEQGWHRYIPSLSGARGTRRAPHVSQRCYYAYRLHPRIIQGNEIDYLFRGGRLFQQYMVDAWASVEGSNLFWIRHNQKQIRADLYKGLVDAANADDQSNLEQQGT